jgi:hypothetical protein
MAEKKRRKTKPRLTGCRAGNLHFHLGADPARRRTYYLTWMDEDGNLRLQDVSAKFAQAMIAGGASYST